MPIIELPLGWIFFGDAISWCFFHLILSFSTVRIPSEWFIRHEKLFKTLKFESQGDLWQQMFGVKQWKQLIPDGTMFIRNGYNKTALHGSDVCALQEFIVESRRAELTHWISIAPATLFFLWNPLWAGWLNVAYAILFNVPIIIAQRYNRPRLLRLVTRKQNKP